MKFNSFWLATLATTLVLGASQAATVTVGTDSTTVANTTALTGFATTGDRMAGMSVKANFANNASETLIWAATGFETGGVAGTLFNLNLSGDTFDADWNLENLSNSPLTELSINAGVGNTVFDIAPVDEITPGSANGRAFEDRSSAVLGDIEVLYSVAVALNGTVHGDLFASMVADFTGLGGGGPSGRYAFGADTDSLLVAGDLTPVPIPPGIVLFATGLGVVGLFGWRRKRKTVLAG